MSALLTLVFLVAVVWLLARAEEKGVLHIGGGAPAAIKGVTKNAHDRRHPRGSQTGSTRKKGGVLRNAAFLSSKHYGN